MISDCTLYIYIYIYIIFSDFERHRSQVRSWVCLQDVLARKIANIHKNWYYRDSNSKHTRRSLTPWAEAWSNGFALMMLLLLPAYCSVQLLFCNDEPCPRQTFELDPLKYNLFTPSWFSRCKCKQDIVLLNLIFKTW